MEGARARAPVQLAGGRASGGEPGGARGVRFDDEDRLRTFVRQLFKLTGGEDSAGGFGGGPQEGVHAAGPARARPAVLGAAQLRGGRIASAWSASRPAAAGPPQGLPAVHREGFEDAVAAFPEAVAVTCAEPATAPEFAHALRGFCAARNGARIAARNPPYNRPPWPARWQDVFITPDGAATGQDGLRRGAPAQGLLPPVHENTSPSRARRSAASCARRSRDRSTTRPGSAWRRS